MAVSEASDPFRQSIEKVILLQQKSNTYLIVLYMQRQLQKQHHILLVIVTDTLSTKNCYNIFKIK